MYLDQRSERKRRRKGISKEKQYSQGTGGGPPLPPPEEIEKTTEEKIYEIITPVAIQGNQDVLESEIIFEESSELAETEQTFESNEIDFMDIQEVDATQDDVTENIENPILYHDYTKLPPEISRPDKIFRAKKEEIQGKVVKRYTKSARLTDFLRNNKKFLDISQKGIVSTNSFRERKLKLLEKHYETESNYYQKKIEAFEKREKFHQKQITVLTEISNAVNKISAATFSSKK
ncbi:unnamed protein product [Ceutorhynchus assimilis]|uniref:Uncharacterized protein n=1 Tax=Ceutorhynchus assimilis TaxID=467358 RepID=A0A9N9MH15_9CUCU|nr:unnamed protein product [Ceutorhynchus assimilis]